MATWSYNRRWWVHSGERLVHVNRGSLYLIGTMMPITVWASRVLHRNEHIHRNIDLLSSDFFSRRWGYKRGLKARKFPTRTSFPCSMFGVIFWKTAISTKNGRRMFLHLWCVVLRYWQSRAGFRDNFENIFSCVYSFFRLFFDFRKYSEFWYFKFDVVATKRTQLSQEESKPGLKVGKKIFEFVWYSLTLPRILRMRCGSHGQPSL